jgi:hypothetical protein
MGEKENSPPSKGTQAMKETTTGAAPCPDDDEISQPDASATTSDTDDHDFPPAPSHLDVLSLLVQCDGENRRAVWRFLVGAPTPDEVQGLQAHAGALIAQPGDENEVPRAIGRLLLATFGGGK